MAVKKNKLREPDPEGLLRELRLDGPYTEMDRYRDFREVFTSSPAGKRVLGQILQWCGLWVNSPSLDHGDLAECEGKKRVAVQLMATIEIEPKERPTTSTRKKVGERHA